MITLAQYYTDGFSRTNIGIKAVINNVEVFVPINESNSDYAEIMRQVEAGELTIQDAD